MAKNNRARWISTIVGLVFVVLAFVGLLWAAATQNSKLDTTAITQVKMRQDVDANTARISAVETDIAVMQTDIKYIRQDTAEILKEISK